MSRWYSGDIEGKFWFGIQSSHAADRFGVNVCKFVRLDERFDCWQEFKTLDDAYNVPGDGIVMLRYSFLTDDLTRVQGELDSMIANLHTMLGNDKYQKYGIDSIRTCHQDNEAFNVKTDIIWNHSHIDKLPINIVAELADFALGCSIENSILNTTACNFYADLE